jgi:predicted RNA-binding protein with PIN domain
MPYLIDGHNLIGSIPDIHIDDPEDELQLIHLLSNFLKNVRKSGTVYFDRRGPGAPRELKSGRLKVIFTTSPNTADLAIKNKLHRLKGEARNYTVVSSDHEVMQAARNAGAHVLESHMFKEHLDWSDVAQEENEKAEGTLSPDDVQFWQQMFKNPPEK